MSSIERLYACVREVVRNDMLARRIAETVVSNVLPHYTADELESESGRASLQVMLGQVLFPILREAGIDMHEYDDILMRVASCVVHFAKSTTYGSDRFRIFPASSTTRVLSPICNAIGVENIEKCVEELERLIASESVDMCGIVEAIFRSIIGNVESRSQIQQQYVGTEQEQTHTIYVECVDGVQTKVSRHGSVIFYCSNARIRVEKLENVSIEL